MLNMILFIDTIPAQVKAFHDEKSHKWVCTPVHTHFWVFLYQVKYLHHQL
jgi:hypothetical protein